MKSKIIILLILFSIKLYSQELSKQDSLLLLDYHAAGVPSLNRDWSPQDYKTATETIVKANKNKTLGLPNHNNSSGLIFNKICEFDTYWFLKSERFTDTQKSEFRLSLVSQIGSLLVCYILEGNNANKKLKYSYEVSVCTITTLRLFDKVIDSSRSLIAKEANLNQTQKEGLAQFKHGVNTSISGMFETLEKDYVYYEENDICNIADAFVKFYVSNRDVLDQVSRDEFDRRLTNLGKQSKVSCIRQTTSKAAIPH